MSASKPIPIPAVAYVRKSTKGTRADGTIRQEKSLAQQRTEMLKLAQGRFDIVAWFEDDGVSGWKRGAKRPGFHKMLARAQALGAQAVICDRIDRFSRAANDEVEVDAKALRKAGVRWIVTASHDEFDLTARYDLGAIVKFASAVWGACYWVRGHSRLISVARRNKALEGLRSGGTPAYGMRNDGEAKGRVVPGDPEEVKVVQRIFRWFGERHRSARWIAGELCRRKVPGPHGGKWWVRTVLALLRRECYKGDFAYGKKSQGQFHCIDARGEVVEKPEGKTKEPGKVFRKEKVYEPIVSAALWNKVRRRLELVSKDLSLRARTGRYALSPGILRCGHCGRPLTGFRLKQRSGNWGATGYRCNSSRLLGPGHCPEWAIPEDLILPTLMAALGRQIKDAAALATQPPDELLRPGDQRRGDRSGLQRQRDDLAKLIEGNVAWLCTLKHQDQKLKMQQKIDADYERLAELDAELATPQTGPAYTKEEWQALLKWWDDNLYAGVMPCSDAVGVPVPQDINWKMAAGMFQNPEAEGSEVLVDPVKVSEALRQLGTEVTVMWVPHEWTTKSGKKKRNWVPDQVRFKVGQETGRLSRCELTPSAERRSRTA
jgi:hypothetical protein